MPRCSAPRSSPPRAQQLPWSWCSRCEGWRDRGGLGLHARLVRKRLWRGFRIRGEMLGDLDTSLNVLIPAPSVFFNPLPCDAELLTVLRPGRQPQYDAPPVERLHFDLRPE